MKVGVVFLVLQVISLIPSCVTGENLFDNSFPYIIGRFLFGIIGIILIVRAYGKKKNGK